MELLQYTAALPGGSGQWNSYSTLPHCLGAVGGGTPAMHWLSVWGQKQWNFCYALPHCLHLGFNRVCQNLVQEIQKLVFGAVFPITGVWKSHRDFAKFIEEIFSFLHKIQRQLRNSFDQLRDPIFAHSHFIVPKESQMLHISM